MNVTEETKAIAQGILDWHTVHPDMHDQSHVWGAPIEDEYDEYNEPVYNDVSADNIPDGVCGTVMCIAGTAIYLDGGKQALAEMVENKLSWESEAGQLLGLSRYEARHLFFTMDDEKAMDATRAIADGNETKFKEILDLHDNVDIF